MFKALASLLHQRRRLVLLASLVLLVVAGAIGSSLQQHLTNGASDYDDPGGGNVTARKVIQQATGIDPQQGYVLLVRTDAPLTADAPVPPEVAAAVNLLKARSEVKRVLDYSGAHLPALIAEDGRSTVVLADLGTLSSPSDVDAVKALEHDVAADPLLKDRTLLGGATVGHVQVGEVSEKDLGMAETLSLPILLVLLVIVFRGLVAGLIPLLGGVFAMMLAMLGTRVLTLFTNVSTSAMNLIFALGLGLCIDFSLLMVSRFREEYAAGVEAGAEGTARAVRRTVLTAGRTVAFSAFTVAVALSALLIFPLPYLRSLGSSGILTVLSAAFFALVVLPAVLAVLGPKIDALSFRRGRAEGAARVVRRWERLAYGVMRRPLLYAVAGVVVLLGIAAPVTGIKFTGVDQSVLPRSVSAGQVAEELGTKYAQQPASVRIVLDAPSDAGAALGEYGARVGQVPGVQRVGAPVQLDAGHWQIDASVAGEPLQAAALDTVQQVQRTAAPFQARFTGASADFLAQRASIGDHLLPAGLVLAGLTVLLLFLFTGSVWLAFQGLLMNALSVAAAFGMLVWVFQQGHLSGLLDFTATGALEETSPVVLFALAFGLSTDYNVFLLGRIKEARATGLDERSAVAVGISRTGGIVTSAALLFFVAIGALGLSRLAFIKELGLGAAFAVLIDAAVVRTLLVPAVMAMLGKAAWWAPGPLKRLHERFGVDEGGAADEEERPRPVPGRRHRSWSPPPDPRQGHHRPGRRRPGPDNRAVRGPGPPGAASRRATTARRDALPRSPGRSPASPASGLRSPGRALMERRPEADSQDGRTDRAVARARTSRKAPGSTQQHTAVPDEQCPADARTEHLRIKREDEMADRLWWRVPRLLHLLMHQIWAGLVATGSMAGLVPPARALELIIESERPPELPSGHPERLVPDLPPTAQEAELWRQLEFLDRLV